MYIQFCHSKWPGTDLLRWLWNLTFRSVCWEKVILSIGGLGVSSSRCFGMCRPSSACRTCGGRVFSQRMRCSDLTNAK